MRIGFSVFRFENDSLGSTICSISVLPFVWGGVAMEWICDENRMFSFPT